MKTRKSRVYKIWGDRRRKFLGTAIYRDQVWFYDDPGTRGMNFLDLEAEHGGSPTQLDGHWWRLDDWGNPLRLYLDRRVLAHPLGTIRLHVFHAGDDDVPHDHPWWFVTFPLDGYYELIPVEETCVNGESIKRLEYVAPLRPHFRRAAYQHVVQEPERGVVRTLVLTGRVRRKWGFWPHDGEFHPFDEWTKYD